MKVKCISKILENKKISNLLNKEGTTEIGIVSLKIIGAIAFISILINLYFITKFGVVFQQVIRFPLNAISWIISGLKHFDEHYPGTLSFLGAILGGGLGFAGALIVFKKQAAMNRKQALKKLMHQLIYTYRLMMLSAELLTDREFENQLKDKSENSTRYKTIIYDSNWRDYISEVKDYYDTENIVRWFNKIENEIIKSRQVTISHAREIEDILKKYGFEDNINEIQKEIKYQKSIRKESL